MRKIVLLASLATIFGITAQNTVTLDLSKATTPLTFDADNGSWTETYNDDAKVIESQCFMFVHSSYSEWYSWWGFTASTSFNNTRPENTLTHQWSNMAPGGIELNEDGTVKTDKYGAPVTSADVPYLVAFYSPYMSERSIDMAFKDGKSYEPVGAYINLTSYTYYTLEVGDAYARAFNNGDDYSLTFHGVGADGIEKTVTVSLASYTNGCITINRGWQYVDLSSLGAVNEIYFTLTTTDVGVYGDNTPMYFCMDKLTVKEANNGGINSVKGDMPAVNYNRATGDITVDGAEFAIVYDVTGAQMGSTDTGLLNISHLPAGVYVVKAGNNSVKIVR